MAARLKPYKVAPQAMAALSDYTGSVNKLGLEFPLLELVRIRASQINGCAYCLHMHTRDARAAGEAEERLYLLDTWRESPFYTDRERAALAWTEGVTLIASLHAADEAYEELRQHFSEEEIVMLTLAINGINAWNRVSIAFRIEPRAAPREGAVAV